MSFEPSQIEDDCLQTETNRPPLPQQTSSETLRRAPGSFRAQRISKLPLLLAAPLILLYAFVVPPFQVPDEDAHLLRAYGVSEGDFIARQTTRIPASFLSLAERFCPLPERFPRGHALRIFELANWAKQPLKGESVLAVSNPTADVYSFVPYLPSSLVFRAGRLIGSSPVSQLYAARLINGAIYVCATYWAIAILPEFQLLLLTIALTPMALNQAASLSADSVTLALTALLTAWIFKLTWDDKQVRLGRRQRLSLVLLFVLVTLCKFYPWTALLVFLVPSKKLGSKRESVTFKITCSLAVCVSGLGWQFLNHPALAAFEAWRASLCCVPAQNSAFMVQHPLRFVQVIVFTDSQFYLTWISQFIGMLGWLSVRLNPLLVVAYAVSIGVAARIRTSDLRISNWQKTLLLSYFLLTILFVHVTQWVFSADSRQMTKALAGTVLIPCIQGRYFLPVALPALVLISSRPFWLRSRTLWMIVSVILAVNIHALIRVWQAYS